MARTGWAVPNSAKPWRGSPIRSRPPKRLSPRPFRYPSEPVPSLPTRSNRTSPWPRWSAKRSWSRPRPWSLSSRWWPGSRRHLEVPPSRWLSGDPYWAPLRSRRRQPPWATPPRRQRRPGRPLLRRQRYLTPDRRRLGPRGPRGPAVLAACDGPAEDPTDPRYPHQPLRSPILSRLPIRCPARSPAPRLGPQQWNSSCTPRSADRHEGRNQPPHHCKPRRCRGREVSAKPPGPADQSGGSASANRVTSSSCPRSDSTRSASRPWLRVSDSQR